MKKVFLGALFCAAIVSMTFTSCKDDNGLLDLYMPGETELWPAEQENSDGDIVYGFINKSGEVVIKGKYDGVTFFHEDRALVMIENSDGSRTFKYVDKDGVEYGNYSWALPYNCGLALVMDNKGVCRFIDKDGNEVINLGEVGAEEETESGDHFRWKSAYMDINSFCDNMACFQDTFGYYGYMDTKGEIVIPAQYVDASFFSEGTAFVQIGDVNSGSYGPSFMIAPNGLRLLENKDLNIWGAVEGYMNGICAVADNNGYTYMDNKGKKFPYYYNDVHPFIDKKLASAQQGEKWGLLNTKGEFVVAATFDWLAGFKEERAVFAKYDSSTGTKFGVIDKDGKEIVAATYNYMGNDDFYFDEYRNQTYHNGLIHTEKDGDTYVEYSYIDINGKEVWRLKHTYAASPAPARRARTTAAKEEKKGFDHDPFKGLFNK